MHWRWFQPEFPAGRRTRSGNLWFPYLLTRPAKLGEDFGALGDEAQRDWDEKKKRFFQQRQDRINAQALVRSFTLIAVRPWKVGQ